MVNRTIDFKGTLQLAIEVYDGVSCPLERKIKDWITALKKRGCRLDMHLHIYATKRKKWLTLKNEYVCNVVLNEVAIDRNKPLCAPEILQCIFCEKFYSND